MKSLAITILVLSAATPALAQDDVVLPAARSLVARTAETGPSSRDVRDKKFWLMAGALTTTMVLDTKSTFDVVRNCRDCREANPFVAPFVRRGPTLTYAAGMAFDAGVMTLAAKMKGSSHTWARRTWWVVPAALVVGHSVAQRHNVKLLE